MIEERRYPYQTLQETSSEIRLLTLTPDLDSPPTSNSQTPISCSLIHASLDQKLPPYFALSYTWGNPENTALISVDGVLISITQNLHDALARLQHHRFFDRPIWIDALCINQADVSEKNVQVPLMSRIYSMAECVIIWLGPDRDYGALRSIATLGVLFRQQVNVRWSTEYYHEGREIDLAKVKKFVRAIEEETTLTLSGCMANEDPHTIHDSPNTPARMRVNTDALWRLYIQRPWWRRVWAIQEAVLAKRALVLVGNPEESSDKLNSNKPVPWEDVMDGMRLLHFMQSYRIPKTESDFTRRVLDDFSDGAFHLLWLSHMYHNSLKRGYDGIDLARLLIYTYAKRSQNYSNTALYATDPRDKIYGLLALVGSRSRNRIRVDYSAETTVIKVLTSVGRLLLHDRGPIIFMFCTLKAPLTSSGELPSWAPDWTWGCGLFQGRDRLSDVLLYNAAKGKDWKTSDAREKLMQATLEPSKLSLPGVLLVSGQVTYIGSEFTEPHYDKPSAIGDCADWLLEIQRMVEMMVGNEPDGGPAAGVMLPAEQAKRRHHDDIRANLWRIAVADGQRRDTDDVQKENYIRGFNALAQWRSRTIITRHSGSSNGNTSGDTEEAGPTDSSDGPSDDEMLQVHTDSLDYRLNWQNFARRAFVDGAGRPGLAPREVLVGDRIAIFLGGAMPVLLRPCQSDSLGDSESEEKIAPQYRVLGLVYLYGVMDGEVMEDGKVEFSDICLV